jgi:hypothetical protein
MYTKKLFFALCLLASSFIAHSQAQEIATQTSNSFLEKGTWLVGGSLSYINATQTLKYPSSFGGPSSYTSGLFLGSISLASMVSKEFALGAKVTYLTSSSSGISGSNIVAGPTARIYFTNEKSSKVFFLGDVGLNTNGGTAAYSLGLGLANFVSNYVSVDLTGTYGNSFTLGGVQQTQGSSSTSTSVFALQLGLQVYLPRKK